MKKFIIPVILLILIGFQNSLFEYIKIFGVKPDIVLVFIICFTLVKGNPSSTLVGMTGGMLEDIFFQGAFGINSIACMMTAFLIGTVERKIFKDNFFIPGIFTFIGTLAKELIVYLFLYLTRTNLNIAIALTNKIVPEAIYNTILAVIFFRYVLKLNNKFFTEDTWRF